MSSFKNISKVFIPRLVLTALIAWLVPPVYAIAKDFRYEVGLLLKNIKLLKRYQISILRVDAR